MRSPRIEAERPDQESRQRRTNDRRTCRATVSGAEARLQQIWQTACRSEVLCVTALLTAFIVPLLGRALLGDRILLPADLLFDDALWRSQAPPDFREPANSLLSDEIFLYYPWRFFSQQAARQYHEFPLWNPFVFCGQPFVANGQSAQFYPLHWMALLIPPDVFFGWAGALRLYLAGLFTYLFLRSCGAGKPASLLSGLAYALCGPMVVWLSYPVPDVFLWLPAALWALERAFSSHHPAPWLALLALVLGTQGLAGHFQSYFHALVVTGLYAGYKLLSAQRVARSRMVRNVILAIAAGLALTAIELLPFAEFLAESGTLAAGGRSSVRAVDRWWYSPSAASNLAAGMALFVPDFYGNPATHDYFWPFHTYQNYNEQTTYVGTLPLLLALASLLRARDRKRVFFVGLAIAAFGVASRLPFFEVVNHLPVFSMILNKRLRFVLAFALAILAGWGADDFFKGRPGSRGIALSTRVVGLVSISLALAVGAWYIFVHTVRLGAFTPAWPDQTLQGVLAVFRWDRVRTYLPVLVALPAAFLLCLYARGRLPRTLLILATLVASGGELLILGRGYCPITPRTWLFPDTPALTYLRSLPQPIRVMGADNAMLFNFGMVVGVPQIGGYDMPVSQRLADLYTQLGGSDIHRQRWQPQWPLLEMCGIQYVIGATELPPDRYELVYDGEVRIYRLRQALPRAFSVQRIEIVSREKALNRLLNTQFDHRQVALVEAEPGTFDEVEFIPADNLHITRYEPNRVSVHGHFPGPGFVVLADAYDDDWRAFVDGQSSRIYPVDYLLRGVAVSAGDHTISFVYAPRAYRVGGIVSLLALAGVGFALAFECVRGVPRVCRQQRQLGSQGDNIGKERL